MYSRNQKKKKKRDNFWIILFTLTKFDLYYTFGIPTYNNIN